MGASQAKGLLESPSRYAALDLAPDLSVTAVLHGAVWDDAVAAPEASAVQPMGRDPDSPALCTVEPCPVRLPFVPPPETVGIAPLSAAVSTAIPRAAAVPGADLSALIGAAHCGLLSTLLAAARGRPVSTAWLHRRSGGTAEFALLLEDPAHGLVAPAPAGGCLAAPEEDLPPPAAPQRRHGEWGRRRPLRLWFVPQHLALGEPRLGASIAAVVVQQCAGCGNVKATTDAAMGFEDPAVALPAAAREGQQRLFHLRCVTRCPQCRLAPALPTLRVHDHAHAAPARRSSVARAVATAGAAAVQTVIVALSDPALQHAVVAAVTARGVLVVVATSVDDCAQRAVGGGRIRPATAVVLSFTCLGTTSPAVVAAMQALSDERGADQQRSTPGSMGASMGASTAAASLGPDALRAPPTARSVRSSVSVGSGSSQRSSATTVHAPRVPPVVVAGGKAFSAAAVAGGCSSYLVTPCSAEAVTTALASHVTWLLQP